MHGEDPRSVWDPVQELGSNGIQKKELRSRLKTFRVVQKWDTSRFGAKKIKKANQKFPFDPSCTKILASHKVYIDALSSFVVQVGHLFILWHFYSTPKLSCESHLTSYKQT